MRSVSRSVRRVAVGLVLLTVFVAQNAAARDRENNRDLGDRLDQARRFIVSIFSRFGTPPG